LINYKETPAINISGTNISLSQIMIRISIRKGNDCTVVTIDGGVQVLRVWLDAGAQLQDATPFLWMILDKKTGE
jgi:hypothetical protein